MANDLQQVPLSLTACQHVIWDWNGTLVDDIWLCLAVLNDLTAARGLPAVTREQYLQGFNFPVRTFYEQLGFDFVAEPFETVSTQFVEGYYAQHRRCGLHTGAEAVLQQLHAAGLGQSILSAAHQDHLEPYVKHYGLERYFSGIYGIDSIHAPGKVEQGLACRQRLGLPGEAVLYIGDTLHDFEVAEAMGVRSLLIAHGHHSYERLAGSGTPVVRSFAELVHMLS